LVYHGIFEDDKYHTGNKSGNEGMLYQRVDSKDPKNENSIMKYCGPFKNGKMHGKNGILYNLDGTVYYQGEFSNDQFSGKGNLFHPTPDKNGM
jgi:hypothetical protein